MNKPGGVCAQKKNIAAGLYHVVPNECTFINIQSIDNLAAGIWVQIYACIL